MTSLFLALLFGTLLLLLAVPILFLGAELAAALLPADRAEPAGGGGARPPAGILIPAHDEEQGIAVTVAEVQSQMSAQDRLLVVADNCTDQTAAVAGATGAEVLVRQDADRRGKGYALDYGLRHWRDNPPEVVVILDADVTMAPGTLEKLIRVAQQRQRPVQAQDLLLPPCPADARTAISAFAFLCKNLVRPLGLGRLGGGCLLAGTGMAFPWRLIQGAALANNNIVEDMQLGIDLALSGTPPLFCPEAVVWSDMAPDARAARAQHTRWEHGHLLTLRRQVGPLLRQALRQRRLDLLLLGLELGVPPLALLVMLWAGLGSVAALLTILGPLPMAVAVGFGLLGLLLALTLLAAWWGFARKVCPLRHLLAIPCYVLGKVPIYIGFLVNPQKEWVRTPRKHETSVPEDHEKTAEDA